MKGLLASFLTIILIIAVQSCKKNSQPAGPDTPPIPPTKTQVDIPWPGLASSAWPMLLHDPQHTGRSPFRGPQRGQLEWRFDANGVVFSSPVIGNDGTVYFSSASPGHLLYAVSPSGAQLWSGDGSVAQGSALLGNDGTVYNFRYALYAYHTNGLMKWMYPIAVYEGDATPVISIDGHTIFVAEVNLYAVRDDGTLNWQWSPDSTEALLYAPAISPDGTTLYVTGRHALYAVDTAGTLEWAFPCSPTTPSVDSDGNIYVRSGNNLYSLSPGGSVRWSVSNLLGGALFDVGQPIGRDGTIYLIGPPLYAIDYSGNIKWTCDIGDTGGGSIPAIDAEGTLYFGVSTTHQPADSINFYAINSDGSVKFRMSLRNTDGSVPDIDSRPTIAGDGSIYVGCDYPSGRYLFKLR